MIKSAWDRVTRDNVLRAFSASIFIGAACLAFATDSGAGGPPMPTTTLDAPSIRIVQKG
jgi:hypothetical protein